ncbi:MAG: DUF3788 family protein [Spirochaetes bacterium]|nr:DUF3788 family protein [Spirochaetota bacterium]
MPNEESLRAALARSFAFFEALVRYTGEFSQEWKYYNRRYGWTLKVIRKKKAFLWMTPYNGYFHLGFSLRKAEKAEFAAEALPEKTRRVIADAKEFPEGFAVRFTVTDEKSFREVFALVELLVRIRK